MPGSRESRMLDTERVKRNVSVQKEINVKLVLWSKSEAVEAASLAFKALRYSVTPS